MGYFLRKSRHSCAMGMSMMAATYDNMRRMVCFIHAKL